MNTPSHFAAALAVSFTLLSHDFAMAAGSATASISNVQLGVLDLTPDDGIAAGYDIGVISTHLTASLFSATGTLTDELAPGPYQASSVRVDQGLSFAQSHTSGAIGDLASGAAAYPNLGVRDRLSVFHQQSTWVTLRAHTLLTVGGDFDLLAQRVPDGAIDYSGVSAVRASIYHEPSNSRFESTRIVDVIPEWSDANQLHDDFFLTYANGTSHDMQVLLYFNTALTVSPVAAVPEPETWSMLGAGLVVLSAAAGRRRRQG